MSAAGDGFTEVANTVEAVVGSGAYQGSHPVGSRVVAKGDAPAFVEIRDVQSGDVVVLGKGF